MISILGDIEYNTVFCDWLSVTYSPDDNIEPELKQFLSSNDFVFSAKSSSGKIQFYRPLGCKDLGYVRLETHFRFAKVSISGVALSFLRHNNIFSSFLSILALQPHRVTRLDLSIDIAKDFPLVLHGLRIHYPDGMVSFSRKKRSVQEILSHRPDGKVSGTYYIGTPKSAIRARVYDKSFEIFEKTGDREPPITRYELIFKGGVSLKDASGGAPLFWKHASVLLLDYLRPPKVPAWVDGSDFSGWTFDIAPNPPRARMQRLLSEDHLLEALERISSLLPHGDEILDRLIREKLAQITADRLAKLVPQKPIDLNVHSKSSPPVVSPAHSDQIAAWAARNPVFAAQSSTKGVS